MTTINKLDKQKIEKSDNLLGERLGMELRNVSQNFYGRNQNVGSPNVVPFSSYHLVNEPNNKFVEEGKVNALDEMSENNNIRSFEKIMSVYSPTSSRSSNSDHFCSPDSESLEKSIGNLQITNLQESPRRLGTSDVLIEHHQEKFCEFQKLSMHSPNSFPKRAPGFPKVI